MNTNSGVIWTVCIASLVLLVAGIFGYASLQNSIPAPAAPVDVPTAAEIAALIVVPAAPAAVVTEVDSNQAKLDKLCELTDGCEFYEPASGDVGSILSYLNEDEAVEDFVEKFANVIDLEDDEFEINGVMAEDISSYGDMAADVEYKDSQIRAYSSDDKDDGNWNVQVLLRVTYQDIDEADESVAYVLVTSTLDENDYESLSVSKVSRSFEFA
jgi:hypothetical protein